jgi:predicted porin
LGTAPAYAADLGGDCCADLEERVAELEATTARKGNRKVSLEISGHVNEELIWWDDGRESNVYQVTNDNSRTRFRFKGKAKIDADWEAGYLIEIGIRTANSKRFTQNNDEGDDTASDVGLDLRDSVWYIKSKKYGTGWVGLTASSTDQITEVNLTQTKDFAKYSDVEDTGLGLFLRSSANQRLSALSWRRLLGDSGDQPGEGERRFNLVKWDSPTIAGFTASASWGEDDFWDIALRYAGEFGGFKLAAGIGYLEITDGPETKTECNARGGGLGGSDDSCQQFGGSVSVIHEKTGLFLNLGAGQKKDEAIATTTVFAGTGANDDQWFWSAQAGIERKFNEYGKTTIYGEYYDYSGAPINRIVDGPDGGVSDAVSPFLAGNDSAIWDTGLQVYGAGIAQGFDKAALVLYLTYRHVEGDLTLRQLNGAGAATGAIGKAALDDLDLVTAGGIIKF